MQTLGLMQLRDAAEQLAWRRVPELMLELYEKSAGVAAEVRTARETLPPLMPGYGNVYWNADTKELWVVSGDSDERDVCDAWKRKLGKIPGVESVRVEAEYSPLGKEEHHPGPWVKVAGKPPLQTAGEALNFFPNAVNKLVPGLQSPLGATLTGGLIGAGLGYAGGTALETLMPESWEHKRLRRTLALLGGLGGASPGLLWGAVNHANDKSPLDGWPLNDPATPPGPPPLERIYEPIFSGKGTTGKPFTRKFGSFESETGLGGPGINVNEFNQIVWTDPRVAGRLSPVMQAATSGLLTGAATLAGQDGQAKLITPWDVGRMAAGMGSGFLSGALVGKALGVLTGMPEPVQDRLKQTGMWAGVIANMVPLAFRGA